MKKHSSPISGIASYSNMIATAGYDNKIILWDKRKNIPINVGNHEHLANQCSFSPCGNLLISASSDYSAKLWKVPSMELVATFLDHSDDVEMAAFHPSKKLIATACRDSIVRVFDYRGNIIEKFSGHRSDAISVTWGIDENQLISSSDDGTIRIWNLISKKSKIIDLEQVETDSMVILNDKTIYAGNDRGEIVEIKDGKILSKTIFFSAGIKKLIKNEENQKILALSYDRTMKLFEISKDGQLTPSIETTFPDIVWPRSAAFTGDNIVLGSFGDCYAIFSILEKKWKINHIRPTDGINAISIFKNNHYTIGDSGILKCNNTEIQSLYSLCNFLCSIEELLLTGGQKGVIYNALSGEELYQSNSPINCMTSWKIDSQSYCAIGDYIGNVIVFKVYKNKLVLVKKLNVLENAIKGISCNKDTIFVVGAARDSARISTYDLIINKMGISHDKIANGCAHLTNNIFVSISRDLKLRFFNSDYSDVIKTPHDHSIKAIDIDPSGSYIATGSYFGRIAIYDVLAKKWKTIIRPTKSGISCLTFDQITKKFLASSYDGQVYSISIEE